jgi:hypothetical protein
VSCPATMPAYASRTRACRQGTSARSAGRHLDGRFHRRTPAPPRRRQAARMSLPLGPPPAWGLTVSWGTRNGIACSGSGSRSGRVCGFVSAPRARTHHETPAFSAARCRTPSARHRMPRLTRQLGPPAATLCKRGWTRWRSSTLSASARWPAWPLARAAALLPLLCSLTARVHPLAPLRAHPL